MFYRNPHFLLIVIHITFALLRILSPCKLAFVELSLLEGSSGLGICTRSLIDSFSFSNQDDSYLDSYISTIGVDFVSFYHIFGSLYL